MSYTKDSPILKNNDLQWEYGCGANGMNPDQLAIATGAGYGMTPEQAISQLAPTLAKQMSVMSFGSKMDGSNVTQYDGISAHIHQPQEIISKISTTMHGQ